MNKELVEILKGITRLEANQETMQRDIADIKDQDREQNRLIDEHIAGVKSAHKRIDQEKESWDKLFKSHEENSKSRDEEIIERLEVVEFVPNLIQNLWKAIKWLGALSAAIAAITKMFGLW